MYKYKINFRYRTSEGNLRSDSHEFTIPNYIERDGAGAWRIKVINIIQAQKGIPFSSVENIGDSSFSLQDLGKVKESKGVSTEQAQSTAVEKPVETEEERLQRLKNEEEWKKITLKIKEQIIKLKPHWKPILIGYIAGWSLGLLFIPDLVAFMGFLTFIGLGAIAISILPE
jgi:hypothetical protein